LSISSFTTRIRGTRTLSTLTNLTATELQSLDAAGNLLQDGQKLYSYDPAGNLLCGGIAGLGFEVSCL
jgi:hypothetical protein